MSIENKIKSKLFKVAFKELLEGNWKKLNIKSRSQSGGSRALIVRYVVVHLPRGSRRRASPPRSQALARFGTPSRGS